MYKKQLQEGAVFWIAVFLRECYTVFTFQEIVSGVSAIVSRIRLQQADHVRIPEKSQGIL